MQPVVNETDYEAAGQDYEDIEAQDAQDGLWDAVRALSEQIGNLHNFGAEAIAAPIATRVRALQEAARSASAQLNVASQVRRQRDQLQGELAKLRQVDYQRAELDLANNRLNAEAYSLRLENFKQGHMIASLWDSLGELQRADRKPRGWAKRVFNKAEEFAREQVQRIADDQSDPQPVDEAVDNDEG